MKNRFAVTKDHIKLAKRMNVGWDDCEFGAPGIDPKRPYGNSDVYSDIAEIIGIKSDDSGDGNEWTDDQTIYMDKLHSDMQTVLQIFLVTGQLSAGEYEQKEEYDYMSWKKVK